MQIKPYTDNLIFFDTEFSSLDPYKGEVLSIGMVKMNGEELYLEVECKEEPSEWVKENVVPLLTQPKVSREEATKKIIEFAGKENSYLVSYVIEFDAPFLYKLIGVTQKKGNREFPYHWIILDFASMLFSIGKNPGSFASKDKNAMVKELGIDMSKYKEHHALDDAKMLKEAYLKLISEG
jgi:DNA polymerase-3 subunit epsilon